MMRAALADPELLPLGIVEGASGERVVVAFPLDAVPAPPACFGPAGRGKDAAR
jgi:hypothetical protein